MNKSDLSVYYILDEKGNPKGVDALEWAEWLKKPENRIIAQNNVNGYFVSTIFTGIDIYGTGIGSITLYETMIFNNNNDNIVYERRYHAKEEAISGHAKAVEIAKTWGMENAAKQETH